MIKLRDFFLGVAAGAAIAFGGFLNALAKTYIPKSEIAKILGAFLFPIGLTIVCFCGLALFTGKVGYAYDNKPKYWLYLLNIYIGNFVGAVGIGFLVNVFFKNTDIVPTLNIIANSKTEAVKGIGGAFKTLGFSALCGTLVYIAVFCYKNFKKIWAKVLGIFLAIALFVYLGFDHCIANMFYFMAGLSGFAFKDPFTYINIAIATVGNSIGAILIHFVFRLKKSAK